MKIFVVGGVQSIPSSKRETDLLRRSCQIAGRSIASAGHELITCSPFPDSADRATIDGAGHIPNSKITMHFPDRKSVRKTINLAAGQTNRAKVALVPHAPPERESKEGWRNAWLLSQLFALDECDAVVAIGGKVDGTASLLLQVASGKHTPVLPFTFLGGAAQKFYDSHQYTLADALSAEHLNWLADPERLSCLPTMLNALLAKGAGTSLSTGGSGITFFVSYPRARPGEADFVEMELRRRGLTVLRDEHDFGAGYTILQEIRNAINRANVFIALWSAEYACSPHCFDEMEQALDRHNAGLTQIWTFLVDETRLVPPRARDLLCFPATSREALHGSLMTLLERVR